MLFGSVPDELAKAFGDGTIKFTVNGAQKSATAADIGPRTLLVRQVSANGFFVLAALSRMCVGIRRRRALPSPICA